MLLYKSSCYDAFHCIASACPDTCCQDWDIQVDPNTAAYYASLPGELGEKIRASLREEDGETVISLQDHHCPMQSTEGLCTLQSALGEQALCSVCREFPRLRHDYGTFLELGLEMSCPEAARLLLTTPWAPPEISELPGDTQPDYDEEAMGLLFSSRKTALSLLSRRDLTPKQILSLLFFYGCHVQQLLDGEEASEFQPELSLETAADLAKEPDLSSIFRFFGDLEILTPQWASLLLQGRMPEFSSMSLNFARYLLERYWLQAVSDYDLYCRVKLILISVILVSALPGDFIWNAHLYSKEIENDIDNIDAILDAAYADPIFTDDRLLGFFS